MLRSTFIHVPLLGAETERRLWAAGIDSWEAALEAIESISIGTADRADFESVLRASMCAHAERHHQYFARALGAREAWRAFHDFRDRIVYLDIETDGGHRAESITTIGLYDGQQFIGLVQGRDLDAFRDIITAYGMIVTFFGASFDVPMLQKRFPDVVFDHIHLDLCPTLRRVGLRGGLKKIEKQVGLSRGDETDGLSGWDAVKLWRRYRTHRDERALETLIAYNRDDVINPEPLAERAYAMLMAEARGESFDDTAWNAPIADSTPASSTSR